MSAWAKVRVSCEILVTYCRVRWSMSRHELPFVVRRMREARGAGAPVSRLARVQLGGAVIRVLSLLPTDSRCLVRSLVLLSLLERRGVASTLVIGVRTEPEFGAHAWIECEREPLLPPGGNEYARLSEI